MALRMAAPERRRLGHLSGRLSDRAAGMASSNPTPAQRRQYRRLRAVLLSCIFGAFVSLVPTAWLFLRSGSSPMARAVAAAVFIELAVSAAVLGAFARCPVCRAKFGTTPGRLLPSRCHACGTRFEDGPGPIE